MRVTLKRIRALWDAHCRLNYGDMGCLHVVCEDGNLEDRTLDRQIADCESALRLLTALRAVSYETRWKAYERFNAEYDITRYNPTMAELSAEVKRMREERGE